MPLHADIPGHPLVHRYFGVIRRNIPASKREKYDARSTIKTLFCMFLTVDGLPRMKIYRVMVFDGPSLALVSVVGSWRWYLGR